jgi:hypothetical protein
MALNDNGDPLLIYYRLNDAGTEFEVRAAHRDGPGWLNRMISSVGDELVEGSRISAAQAPGGEVGVAFHDPSGGMLWYGTWNGTLWFVEQVTVTPGTGQWVSLDFQSDGTPLISHFDASNRDLLLTRGPGPAWTTETVLSTGYVGEHSSLEVRTDDSPVIGCFSRSEGKALFVTREDPDWMLKYATWSFSSPGHLELALDSIGLPAMVYENVTLGETRMLPYVTYFWQNGLFEQGVLADRGVALEFEVNSLPVAATYNTEGRLRIHRLRIPE